MSGTSMDGINATLVYTDGKILETSSFNIISDYSEQTKLLLNRAVEDINLYKKLKKNKDDIDFLVSLDHSKIVKEVIDRSKIKPDLIGFHGQTIFHDPKNNETIQVGSPQLLSDLLGVNVISDFRDQDINNGGQGAPISPIYHKYLITKSELLLPTCFLNIGGIANFTYWDNKILIGFDSGPGNCLMDMYVQNNLNINFDNFGKLASQGKINQKLVDNFLQDSFFIKSYPKSLDRNYFKEYLESKILNKLSHIDAMATLAELTIESIILSVAQMPKKPDSIIIMGGGMNNSYLIKRLSSKLDIKVILANEIDLKGEMIEAELIAYISARSVYKLPITFPMTTGVVRPISGGKLYCPKVIK